MPRLDPANVPLSLRHLIPMAERYGITDDLERERCIRSASIEEVMELKAAIARDDDLLDDWLAGPEANAPSFSEEYLAFSALRMAADYA
jgi:hypothetical protein